MQWNRAGEGTRWLIAACFTALLLCALLTVSQVVFQTNDDNAIVSVLAGYQTGQPEAATIWTTYLYGWCLSTLYAAAPSVPWHGLLMFAAVALSLVAIAKSFLTLCAMHGWSGWLGLGAFTALFLGVYLQYTVKLQFTAVPGICATASFTLVLTGLGTKKTSQIECGLALVLLLIGMGLRPLSVLLTLPLMALCALCLLAQKAADAKRIGVAALAAILLCTAVLITDEALYRRNTLGWDEYQAYDEQATSLMDFSDHARVAELAPEVTDWSPQLAERFVNWFFLDDRINTASMRSIDQVLEQEKPAYSLLAMLKAVGSVLRRYPLFGLNLIAFALLLGIGIVEGMRRRQIARCLMLAGFAAYLVAVIAYLYYFRGRFPDRVAFVLACPAMTLLPLLVGRVTEGRGLTKKIACLTTAVMLLCGGVTALLHWQQWTIPHQGSARQTAMELTDRVNEYVAFHKERVFVTDLPQNFSPWRVYPKGETQNLIAWGHGLIGSPTMEKQFQSLGYEQGFSAQQFFDDRVDLLLSGEEALLPLLSYLQADYGACLCRKVDECDGFTVYHLTLAEGT